MLWSLLHVVQFGDHWSIAGKTADLCDTVKNIMMHGVKVSKGVCGCTFDYSAVLPNIPGCSCSLFFLAQPEATMLDCVKSYVIQDSSAQILQDLQNLGSPESLG